MFRDEGVTGSILLHSFKYDSFTNALISYLSCLTLLQFDLFWAFAMPVMNCVCIYLLRVSGPLQFNPSWLLLMSCQKNTKIFYLMLY